MSKQAVKQDENQRNLVLFGRVSVNEKWKDALKIEHIVKPKEAVLWEKGPKKGQQRMGKNGKPLFRSAKDYTSVAVLPKVAGENEDGTPRDSLARKFETTDGQQLMGIDLQARVETAQAVVKDLMGQVMAGEMIFTRGRRNNLNGNLSLSFKQSGIKVVGAPTKEQAMAVLGISEEQLALAKAGPVEAAPSNGNGGTK